MARSVVYANRHIHLSGKAKFRDIVTRLVEMYKINKLMARSQMTNTVARASL
jgi:hypothetical protein